MRLRRQLVVFVKAPRIGTVKTRLAAGIGPVAAWRFYRGVTDGLLRTVADEPRWQTLLAVTPDAFQRRGRYWPRRIARIGQGRGDLGRRMGAVMATRPPGPVVIVGSDIPELRHRHVAEAFAALETCDAVFGPAADGGYWLVGLKRRPLRPDIFRDVRWSTEHALADTLRNLSPDCRVAMLQTLNDVDTVDDYRRYIEATSE